MAQYRRKADVVEAEQYYAGMPLPPEGTTQDGYPAIVVPALGPIRLTPGQWIVRDPDGTVEVVTERNFGMQYEPVITPVGLLAVRVEHLTEEAADHLESVLDEWWRHKEAPPVELAPVEPPTPSGDPAPVDNSAAVSDVTPTPIPPAGSAETTATPDLTETPTPEPTKASESTPESIESTPAEVGGEAANGDEDQPTEPATPAN